jgi:hypothetical protein
MRFWLRIAVTAAALAFSWAAQATLVKFSITGEVTESGVFPDGSVVPLGTQVTGSYTYESTTAADARQRHHDGSGFAQYAIGQPYHFKLRVGGHRLRASGFRVHIYNNLNQPFGDEYDVLANPGGFIDGTWFDEAHFELSFVSQPGHTHALNSLRLPRRLNMPAFDAFRFGTVAKDLVSPLLLGFVVLDVKSHVCANPVPDTDDCAD